MSEASASTPAAFASLLDDFFYRSDENVSGLLQLDVPSELSPAAAPEERAEEFLSFALGSEVYAVALQEVREIVKVPLLTELPRARPDLLGVMNLRGEVLPVYDVRLRLRLSDIPAPIAGPDAKAPPRGARIVVLRMHEGDAGIYAESVLGVVRLRRSEIEPPPRRVLVGDRDCVEGIGRVEEQLILLLDAAEALS